MNAGAVEYDPFAPAVMADPFPVYRSLRAAGPVHPLPRYDAWALPRFAEVWEVGQDRERCTIAEGPIFSEDQLSRPFDLPPGATAPAGGVPRPLRSFSVLDPPVHTAVRRTLVAPFRPRRVAELEHDMRRHARELLAELVGRGRFDVVADLGTPVAAAATCRLLGFPVADHRSLAELVNLSTSRDPDRPGVNATGRQAREELAAYVVAHVSRQRGTDALVDAVAAAAPPDEPFTDAEIAVQLSTLFVGGVETLPKIVAGGMLRLHDHPDQRAVLARTPEMSANAFEEILRLESVLQWVGRTLLVDAEIGGVRMRAGQRLFLLLVSAGRDEREFPDPERFDIGRRFERTLAFGHGVHFCIGVHAARLAGRVLLEEILAAVPEYGVDRASIHRPPSEFQLGYTGVTLTC